MDVTTLKSNVIDSGSLTMTLDFKLPLHTNRAITFILSPHHLGATVTLHYFDGDTSDGTWPPSRFTEQSNLRANIWSGYLRGWKDKGIVKAEFESLES